MIPYWSKCSGFASLFAPASIRTKIFVSEGMTGGNAGTIDPGESAQFDRGRGDGGTGVTRAYDGSGLAFFHQVNSPTDR